MSGIRKLLAGLVALIVIVVSLFFAYVWITLHWTYSAGERAGLMQKFSQKGWICKTWEGELLLTTMPGLVPEKFEFTVRDEAVARQLIDNAGKRLVLTYVQHKGVPSSCFGDTEYFVEKMQVFKE